MPNSDAVTMYTTTWCGYCVRLKSQMQREEIAFDEVNIERDETAAQFVGSVNGGNHVVPTVLLPDGSTLTNPSIHELKAALS